MVEEIQGKKPTDPENPTPEGSPPADEPAESEDSDLELNLGDEEEA